MALYAGNNLAELSKGGFLCRVPGPAIKVRIASLSGVVNRVHGKASVFLMEISRICAKIEWVLKGNALKCFHLFFCMLPGRFIPMGLDKGFLRLRSILFFNNLFAALLTHTVS